ncbi:MAG: diguanylate cyclase [Oxalobacteraceae bacterium]|nr:diguanylate cyclase [Oxalobacteraceae bacterium]
MRLGVGIKLGFWLALLGIFSTGLTGYYAYAKSRELLISAAEDKLLTATQVLAQRFTFALNEIANDVRFAAALPQVRRLASHRDGADAEAVLRRELGAIFSALLASHPEYFQLRLIGVAHYGRELVRVDRDADGLTAVSGRGLQEKAHFPYVFEAARLPAGKLYLSDININREQGAHQGQGKPTLRLATPVMADGGQVFGVLVINVDLNGIFKQIRKDIPNDLSVLLTNQDGDYLVHPDASKVFGFDRGRRILIQDDIDATAALLDGKGGHMVLTGALDATSPNPFVSAFVKAPYAGLTDRRFVLMGLTTPIENVLRESRMLGMTIIQIMLVFSIAAVIVAFLVSRMLARPLNQMANAVSRFEAGNTITDLPLERNDEIGYLAKSFLSMTSRLSIQLDQLQNRQLHLAYLAHHDPLTGLPNRLLFLDRLMQATQQALRETTQFAVMFIDLDEFKDVNDRFGHAVGDETLKLAAKRMQECLRQTDTLSRLGGDEFTILVEDLHSVADAVGIAQKIVDFFELPFVIDRHSFIMTCSIGIGIYPHHGEQALQLLENADAAMYRAKKQGRSNFQMYA